MQQLVDQLLDRARAEHPDVEYVISLRDELILLMPRDSQKLWRTVEQRLVCYRSHVYRDCEIIESPIDDQVVASPLVTMDKEHS